MGEDFSAAHSMDTEWFAVDRDGQVALFISGENGSVADAAADINVDDVLRALGGNWTEDMEDDWDVQLPELARLGLHVYQDDTEWFSGPYVRTHRPERPLHVDQLPPQLREQVKEVRYDDLRFADKGVLQPCDHAEGHAWGLGYLAEDRKTVRPVPGKEEKYREYIERLRRDHPDVLKDFQIEGLEGT
jgi:hypothetical protein